MTAIQPFAKLQRAAYRHVGALLRHLDPAVLREALSNLLRDREECADGYLIYQIVVERAEPAAVAAERGVGQATLVEMLRDAVDLLAAEYEDVANAFLD